MYFVILCFYNIFSGSSKGPVKSSKLWDYFEKNNENGYIFFKFKICDYKNKGRNYSTLNHHLNSKHSDIALSIQEYQAKKQKNADITIFGVKKPVSFQKEFEEKLIALFSSSTIPIRFVENEGFVNLLQFLNPKTNEVMCKKDALISKMSNRIVSNKNLIIQLINKAEFVSLSCDIWSQKNYQASFIGTTIQFFNESESEIQIMLSICVKLSNLILQK